MMVHKFLSLLVLLPIFAHAEVATLPIEIFPKKIDKQCRDGLAQIYDECGNQLDILAQAQKVAHQQNKRILLVYGAEWCIWDHVFHKHIRGEMGNFRYQWRSDTTDELETWDMMENVSSADVQAAQALNHFVAKHFVVVFIEDKFSNGKDVLKKIGNHKEIYFYPNYMILDKKGRFVRNLPPTGTIKGLQIRESNGEEYRGYNRAILLKTLQALRKSVK